MMELRRYPNLKLIVSMGAGVDHLLRAAGAAARYSGGALEGCAR
jgi:phosphoglycerate dehydrogenase-like enzyme